MKRLTSMSGSKTDDEVVPTLKGQVLINVSSAPPSGARRAELSLNLAVLRGARRCARGDRQRAGG